MVSLSGLPDGVTSTPPSPFTLAPGGSQTVTISATRGTSPGVSTVTVAGIARGSEASLYHSGTFSLSAAVPVYAYVPTSNGVLGYSVDANTGALAVLKASPFTLPARPELAVSTAQGAFLYGRDYPISSSPTLFSVAIDPATGVLTPGQTINDGTLSNSFGITASPNGKFLYVVLQDCIRAYLIDPATGNLTLSSCSSVPAMGRSFLVVPPGNVAYFNTLTTNGTQVYLYSVNQNDGSLTLVQSAQSPVVFVGQMTSDPLGRALYVLEPPPLMSHLECGNLEVLGIDQQTATVTPFGPYDVGCPTSITFDPADQYAYVSSNPWAMTPVPNVKAGIYGLRSDSSGSLTYLTGSPFATEVSPYLGVVEPSQGKFLIGLIDYGYPFNMGSTTLTSFAIDANTGALSQVPSVTLVQPNYSPADLMIVAMPQ
jgi:hypothetical protein